MVFFNYSTMQMAAKVVYYGPGLCGKTTNLHYIYQHTTGESRGEMVSLETETDRTLFFDLLPIDVGSIAGFNTRIQLYTVPGQVFYNTTRKLVLKGVDGVVFVADSQRAMLQTNIESFRNLEENLAEMGLAVDTLPLVLQFNKRDLADICSVDEMNARAQPPQLAVLRELGGHRHGGVRDPQGDLAVHPDVAQEAARPQRAGRRRCRPATPPRPPKAAAPAASAGRRRPAPPPAAAPPQPAATAGLVRPGARPPRAGSARRAGRPPPRRRRRRRSPGRRARWTCWAELEKLRREAAAPRQTTAPRPIVTPPRPAVPAAPGGSSRRSAPATAAASCRATSS